MMLLPHWSHLSFNWTANKLVFINQVNDNTRQYIYIDYNR